MLSSQKPKVVLVSTGAHNPPHPGHLQMLLAAKQKLTEQGYEVLETFTSPSHQQYIEMKQYGKVNINGYQYPRPIFTDKERRRLWRRIIRDMDASEAQLHKYESKVRDQFVQYPEMMREIIHVESGNFPPETCFVYVAGEDMGNNYITQWSAPSPYDARSPRLRDFVIVGREKGINAELESKIAAHKDLTGAQIATSVQTAKHPLQDMSSTAIMSGDIKQLKLLPYAYLLELVNIINHKNPPQIDYGYKYAFLNQVSLALEQLIRENPSRMEYVFLRNNVINLLSEYNVQLSVSQRSGFKQSATTQLQEASDTIKRAHKEKHNVARAKTLTTAKGLHRSRTSPAGISSVDIAKNVGTFSRYIGLDGAPIFNNRQRQAYLAKQLMRQLSPAPGWETSQVTQLSQPLAAQPNRQLIIQATDQDSVAAFGQGRAAISIDTLKKLQDTAFIMTSQSLLPKELYLVLQTQLYDAITHEERRTLGQIFGSYYGQWRMQYQQLGFKTAEEFDKIANIPLNLLTVGVCHSQEVHFFVEQQLLQDGRAVNKLREVNLDSATPTVLLSCPGINFAYGGAITEQYLADGTAKMLIENMWQGVLSSAVKQNCTHLALPAIGLGAFLPASWSQEKKAKVASLYFDTLLQLLAKPEFQGKFEAIHINPVFDFAQQALQKAMHQQPTVTNVHPFGGDVKFLAVELSKNGMRCGLLNPSSPDVMLGKYDVGQYYKNGGYVGEEDFSATSTSFMGSKGVNKVYTDPQRIQSVSLSVSPAQPDLSTQLIAYLNAANLTQRGQWFPIAQTPWGIGISNTSGNRAIANQRYHIEVNGEGKLVCYDKSDRFKLVTTPLDRILDDSIQKLISENMRQSSQSKKSLK
ncbi:MAG: hypothetical protein JSR17_03285 [Proteobacteria bacterium]|nr:hypothetical protein [Pseudomonadota bacterium]